MSLPRRDGLSLDVAPTKVEDPSHHRLFEATKIQVKTAKQKNTLGFCLMMFLSVLMFFLLFGWGLN